MPVHSAISATRVLSVFVPVAIGGFLPVSCARRSAYDFGDYALKANKIKPLPKKAVTQVTVSLLSPSKHSTLREDYRETAKAEMAATPAAP